MAGEAHVESSSAQVSGESSESAIGINIKTLDSQIHSFRVDTNMTIQMLKEKIVEATGVPVEQQRLIFRGKVLKDSHSLSEYGLEDGHTLHLVVRQPIEAQPTTGPSVRVAARTDGNDSSSGPRPRVGQVSHSVVLGTVNVMDQGEGMMAEIQRIVGAVANSLGLGGVNPTAAAAAPSAEAGAPNVDGISQTGNMGQAEFHVLPFQVLNQVSQFSSATTLPRRVIIPDSLATLSEFISRMERAVQNGSQSSSLPTNVEDGPPTSENSSMNSSTIPTSAVLGSVIERARQLLIGNVASALSHVAGRLEREGSSSDPVVRGQIQGEATHLGVSMQHLGAMLLELGRTILMLQMGRSPLESFVNAGPAVYISASGPNPIMVQPFPLQASSSLFGASSPVAGPAGIVDPSRHINIHIHAGSSVARGLPYAGVGSRSQENVPGRQQPNTDQASANVNVSSGAASAHILHPRVVANIPALSLSEATGHVLNMIRPTYMASQHATSGDLGSAQGSQSIGGNVTQSGSVAASQPSSASNPTVALETNATINRDSYPQSQNFISSTIHSVPSQTSVNEARSSVNESSQIHSKGASVGSLNTVGGEGEVIAPECRSVPDTGACMNSSEQRAKSVMEKLDCEGIEHSSSSGKDNNPRELPAPLGLGLGGLHPKRRSKPSKAAAKDEFLQSAIPANTNSESVSGGINANGSVNPLPHAVSRSGANSEMTSSGRGAGGPIDFSSMMSHAFQSPAFSRLVSGIAEQAGMSSPGDLRGMMEQCTQNPGIRNMLNDFVPQIDRQGGSALERLLPAMGRGQGGIDFSSMIQQMMPAISQVLGRGMSSGSFGGIASEPRSEPDGNYDENHTEGKDNQVEIEQAVRRIEQRDSQQNIFRAMLESAAHLSGVEGIDDLAGNLSHDPELTDQFFRMFKDQILERLKEESSSNSK